MSDFPGVRAALPGLRARYGEGRTVRRRRAMDPVDAAERADAAHLRIERRLLRVARMLLRRRPDIGWEDLRAALDESCAPNELGHARDELLDRVVARVHGRFGFGCRAWFRPACALEVTDASARGLAAAFAGRRPVAARRAVLAIVGGLSSSVVHTTRGVRRRIRGCGPARRRSRWREHGSGAVTWRSTRAATRVPRAGGRLMACAAIG